MTGTTQTQAPAPAAAVGGAGSSTPSIPRPFGQTLSKLSIAVSECIDQGGTIDAASTLLLNLAKNDQALYKALLGDFEQQAARRAISRELTQRRKRAFNARTQPTPAPAKPKSGGGKSRRSQATNTSSQSTAVVSRAALLMSFPLIGGKPLGKATRPELLANADDYRSKAASLAVKDRWIRSIAAKLPDDMKTVDAVLSESDLEALRDAA